MDQADLNLIRQMRQLMAEWKRTGALVASPTGLTFDTSLTGYSTRRLASLYTTASSTGTTESTLFTATVAANTLSANGDAIVADFGGEYAAHASATRTVKIKYGGTTLLDTGALVTASADYWGARVAIVRRTASVVTCIVTFVSNGAQFALATRPTPDLTAATTLSVTGQAGGGGALDGDISCTIGLVDYKPA